MEKKFLAILFLIGLIIYAIVQIIPFIIGSLVLMALIYLIKISYERNPKGYAFVGSFLIGPLLLLGWVYIGILAYTNLYYNIYIITDDIREIEIFDRKIFLAKNDDEAIVKAWEYALSYDELKTAGVDDFYYLPKTYIYNWTKDERVDVYTYNIDSLCCDKGKYGIKPYDLFW